MLLLIPTAMMIIGTIIVDESGITTVEEMRADAGYMTFALVGLIISASVNTYIAILLSAVQGRTIHHLKKQFGRTFETETSQIARVLATFTVTFFIRAGYEAALGYRNTFYYFPKQFALSLELMINGLLSYQLPIALIIFLHHRNSRTKGNHHELAGSIYLTEE